MVHIKDGIIISIILTYNKANDEADTTLGSFNWSS